MQQEMTERRFKTLPTAQQKPIIAAAIREAIENRARAGLTDFSQYVDPAYSKWYRARHLRKIASVLERVQKRELTRVIINVPPRHLKSSQVVKWEAKILGDDPTEQIISASRARNLALKFSKQVRRTINSSRYQSLYPDTKIQRGSDNMDDWLVEGGYQSSYRAVGTDGGIVGEGATVLVMDDVSDPGKQSSETETTGAWEWYKEEARTRLDPRGVIVVVNNRVGVNDLTGYLLDEERNDSADPPHVWTVVNLPAYDELTDTFLWEERFGRAWYQAYQNDVHLWNVQYQQKPTLTEGSLIKRKWFSRYLANGTTELDVVDNLPEGASWQKIAIDAAFTEKQTQKHDPDWTARVKGCWHNGVLFAGSPRRFRKDIDGTVNEIVSLRQSNPRLQMGMGRVAIRAKVITMLNKAGYSIQEFPEKLDPVAESSGWRTLAAAGLVRLVGTQQEWQPFVDEWCKFPRGA